MTAGHEQPTGEAPRGDQALADHEAGPWYRHLLMYAGIGVIGLGYILDSDQVTAMGGGIGFSFVVMEGYHLLDAERQVRVRAFLDRKPVWLIATIGASALLIIGCIVRG